LHLPGLTFVPSVAELCEVAVPHLREAENAIVSFGQGCEGDPILQTDVVVESVRQMRGQTTRGTINFNSNASIPDAIDKLAEAGVESIRVSLNSAQESFYNAYYRPRGYCFDDVIESLRRARAAGLYTMLNYLVFPGVSDRVDEIDALSRLIDEIGIDMVQMRNLSLDPVLYLSSLGIDGRGIGMLEMLRQHKRRFPQLQYGYFNRTRETFFPPGYASEWPIQVSAAGA
jgi:molybdenum cofactor biosynthesis enzyme MoaA